MDTTMDLQKIRQVFSDYWSVRAQTYSDDMSSIDLRDDWKAELKSRIQQQFPARAPESIRVLELATGHGYFAGILAELGYTVTAVDLAPGMLEVAKKNCAAWSDRITFQQMNAEELSFPDASFDVVFCRFLTWLLPQPEQAYGQWCRVLKPGGLLLVYDTMLAKERGTEPDPEELDNPSRTELLQRTGMRPELYDDLIRLSGELEIGFVNRPNWDLQVLKGRGMEAVSENVTRLSTLKQSDTEMSQLLLVKGVKK
mgnify:FL=1